MKVNVSVSDGICVIELNDPPANTYSYEMMQEIDAAVLEARMDASVQVIVRARGRSSSARREHRDAEGRRRRLQYYFCLHAEQTSPGSSRRRSW